MGNAKLQMWAIAWPRKIPAENPRKINSAKGVRMGEVAKTCDQSSSRGKIQLEKPLGIPKISTKGQGSTGPWQFSNQQHDSAQFHEDPSTAHDFSLSNLSEKKAKNVCSCSMIHHTLFTNR